MRQMTFFATILTFFAVLGSSCVANERFPLTVVMTDGDVRALSLEELDAMEQRQFSTTTIWTDGEVSFSGVSVAHLLTALGAAGTTVRLSALNDYAVEMPVAELEEDAPIIATRIDGQTIPVRDKGPYWVVFPFDKSPEYRTEVNYARSVWQLQRLTLED